MPEEKKEEKETTEKETTREELYDLYQKQVSEPSPEPEEKKETPAEPAPVAVEEKKEEVKEEKKEEVKQPDPHEEARKFKQATYEERMKRKAEKELREKAEARAAALEARIKALEAHEEPEAEIIDYDKAILDVRKELRETKNELHAIKSFEAERSEREKQEAFDRVQQSIKTNIDKVHSELLEEGYYGFNLALGSVKQELEMLVAEDKANIALDNPAGWKRIYKERIFPGLKAEAEAAEKRRSEQAKINLKQNANLVKESGKMPPKPKADEDKTEQERQRDYLRMRRGE